MLRMGRMGLWVACMLGLAVGCQRREPPPATVETPLPISHPVQREVTDYVDYTGRINAPDTVTVQPRVTGYLMRIPFKEGDYVRKGDVLFEIDPRPYQAQLEAAQASVATNQASLKYAEATNLRYKELAKKQPGAVSGRELDQYQALQDQAVASLDLAKANLLSGQLNLEWTKVTSPIDGHVSRYYLTVGNLVNQDVTQLTTVVSMDPIYVYFDMDEPTLLAIKRAINEGTMKRPSGSSEAIMNLGASLVGMLSAPLSELAVLGASALSPGRAGADAPVLMGLQGEEGFPHAGFINFVDNQVNPGTGSISVRGSFENPRPPGGTYLFLPGMFVRIRLPVGQPTERLLVKDQVITSDQGVKSVFVVDAEGKVDQRRVALGALQEDGLRVVSLGLKKDDWVLIGGLQQVRPRMKILTEQVTMPTLTNPAIVQRAVPAKRGKQGAKKK